jgi:tetratricopeptide (TPR) repeat protein
MFLVVDVVEQMKFVIVTSKQYSEKVVIRSSESSVRVGSFPSYSFKQSGIIFVKSIWVWVTHFPCICRTLVVAATIVLYVQFRLKLNGPNMLYKWTMMENHVHHLPFFYERALSYAQYHALYLLKLVYPAQLCFDYGYSCVPTVHVLADPLNIRPAVAYTAVLALMLYAIRGLRLTLLLGLALVVIPLAPAINVFVPVGTLLAERLLFIPSFGACLIAAEVMCVDLEPFWLFCNKMLSPVVERFSGLNVTTEETSKENRNITSRGQESSQFSPEKQVSFGTPIKSILKRTGGNNGNKLDVKGSETKEKNKGSATKSPSLNKGKGGHSNGPTPSKRLFPLLYIVLVPICLWCSMRVMARNADWFNEYTLYKSGLAVCPRSLKVLTNYAVLAMARHEYDAALDAALAAVEIYPQQIAALINAGVAYQKLGRYAESVEMLRRATREDPDQQKAAGYLGVSYFHWSNSLLSASPSPSPASASASAVGAAGAGAGARDEGGVHPGMHRTLRAEALHWLLRSVELGMRAPAILHLAGSALFDAGRLEESIVYYETALEQSSAYRAYYKHSSTVPVLLEDDVHPAATLNQLGNVHVALGQKDRAIDAFARGIEFDPQNIPLLTNLGNLYRERGDVEKAREMMKAGIVQSGESVPPALLNNLGLLELGEGNFRVALNLFEQALHRYTLELAMAGGGGVGESVATNGEVDVAQIIKGNIKKAQEKLV